MTASTFAVPSPTHRPASHQRKQALNIAGLEALSLEQIEEFLSSDEHYAATQTRNYGDRDPLDSPAELLFECLCGAKPMLHEGAPPERALKLLNRPLPSPDGRAFYVECPHCQRPGSPSLRAWRAVIDWCYICAASQRNSFAAFPFFNLAGLTMEAALYRLQCIKTDLLLRRAHAQKRRASGIPVGGRFISKIEAYLGWANVALKVVTAQGPKSSRSLSAAQPARQ